MNNILRILWWVLAAISGLLVAATLILGIAAAVPGLGLFSGLGSLVFPVFAPWMAVVALIATLFACWRRWRGSPRRTASAVLGAGTIATLLNVVLIAVFVVQVGNAGGSVNPVRGLVLGSMNSPGPDETTQYTTPDGQSFQAAVWKPAPSAEPAPVMVYIHGGGWVAGGPTEGGAEWKWFADHGWLVLSIGYELATQSEHTWERAPQQVACGLAWANDNVGSLGGDASRLVVAGDSAGGNLAINLAYGAASGKITSSCGELPPVRAVVAQYPVVDPVGTWDEGFSLGSSRGVNARDFLSDYIGGSPEQFPDRYRAVASSTYIGADAPPTLVVSPDRDSLITPDGVRTFVDEARAGGVDVTRVDIPFANHGYDAYADGSLGNQARLTITENWLRGHVEK